MCSKITFAEYASLPTDLVVKQIELACSVLSTLSTAELGNLRSALNGTAKSHPLEHRGVNIPHFVRLNRAAAFDTRGVLNLDSSTARIKDKYPTLTVFKDAYVEEDWSCGSPCTLCAARAEAPELDWTDFNSFHQELEMRAKRQRLVNTIIVSMNSAHLSPYDAKKKCRVPATQPYTLETLDNYLKLRDCNLTKVDRPRIARNPLFVKTALSPIKEVADSHEAGPSYSPISPPVPVNTPATQQPDFNHFAAMIEKLTNELFSKKMAELDGVIAKKPRFSEPTSEAPAPKVVKQRDPTVYELEDVPDDEDPNQFIFDDE
jgi:hypothetical protein